MLKKSLSGFPVAALVMFAVVFVPAASAQTPALLHYFKFESGFSSEVSSLVGDPVLSGTSIDTLEGISGNSVEFDGIDGFLLLEGQNILPAGAFTFSFWEKADTLPGDEIPKGYFVCDAAANPLNNLFLRRWPNPVPDGGDVSAVQGMMAETHFAQFSPEDVSTEEWHHHMVTYTDSGVGYWWLDGQLQNLTPTGTPFAGLSEVNPGSGYEYAGLVLGNRLTQDRAYDGHMDEWQIYHGSANGGMAAYLYNNPNATLDTYDAQAYPDPGVPDAPGIRPANATLHRWKFDGNLDEATGTANGTAIGNAVAGTTNGAYAGSGAVAFDGDDDAVTIDSSVIPTNKYSISLWAKDTSGTTGYLFADESWRNLLLRRYDGDNNGEYSVWAGDDDIYNLLDPETEAPFTYDEWHHIVLAVDGEWGNARTYIDGELAATVETVNGRSISTFNIESNWGDGNGFQELLGSLLYLGNRDDLERDYAGLIDDLQIYNWNISKEDAAYLFSHPGSTLMAGIPGDTNGDNIVDATDAAVVADHWGQTIAGEAAVGDFNKDGVVNALDASIMAANWGNHNEGSGEGNAVPEPSTFVLILFASMACLTRRQHHRAQ